MQAPQIVGILIGIASIVVGFFVRGYFLKKEKRVFAGVALSICVYMGALCILQNAIFSYAPTWSWSGVKMIWAGMFGRALVPIILACIGLAFSPNRVLGYVVALVAFTIIMFLGNARAV